MLRVADTATAVVAFMTLLVRAIRLVAAKAMIVLRVGHTSATVVAAVTRFVEPVAFMAG